MKKKHRWHNPIKKKNPEERADKMEQEETLNPELEQKEEPAESTEPSENEAQEQEKDSELLKKLEETQKKCDEYLDLAQRQKAEFLNYKRRTEGVRKEAYDDGRRDAIGMLLPVVDNLERALDAAQEENPLHEGVVMVLRQTRDALAKMGVEEINPLGEAFDAMMMNAVMQGTEEEGEPGTVCQVLQKGYKLGEHVIRHAMVKVVAG